MVCVTPYKWYNEVTSGIVVAIIGQRRDDHYWQPICLTSDEGEFGERPIILPVPARETGAMPFSQGVSLFRWGTGPKVRSADASGKPERAGE